MSSLFDPGRNELFLGCGRFDAAREEAEDGAGEGSPPWGGMKPPGCRGESVMAGRVSVIEYTTEYRCINALCLRSLLQMPLTRSMTMPLWISGGGVLVTVEAEIDTLEKSNLITGESKTSAVEAGKR